MSRKKLQSLTANFCIVNSLFVKYGHRLGTFFQKNALFEFFFGKEISIFLDKVVNLVIY